MRYFKKEKDGILEEIAKSENNFTNGTAEIESTEYNGLVLGIRVFINAEDAETVKEEMNSLL